ncbi:hypothetical protein ML401_23690 [Bradyrhizobium sp. 62B]|uniref:hypothetical protein n=1 Tax=Bradyrhizobium sp. 62B TaxID=2898442 RepID=UPI0025583BD7|nr:hypothetical protein ML401_23690 [Bradyrhizobium sp. 62B]
MNMPDASRNTAMIVPARTMDLVKTLRSLTTAALIVGSTYVHYVASTQTPRTKEVEPQRISSLGSEFGRPAAE